MAGRKKRRCSSAKNNEPSENSSTSTENETSLRSRASSESAVIHSRKRPPTNNIKEDLDSRPFKRPPRPASASTMNSTADCSAASYDEDTFERIDSSFTSFSSTASSVGEPPGLDVGRNRDILSDSSSYSYDSDLENKEFTKMEASLNAGGSYQKCLPPQLTEMACIGLGTPSEVWDLLCRKNEAMRLNKDLILKGADLKEETRAVLVDWMMEVCESENQHRETFHLAVDYVDRFLIADKTVTTETFQCIGTTALLIASKYEEIYPPKLDQFIDYTDEACTEEEVRETEILILGRLNWSLSVLTSIHWLNIFIQLIGCKDLQDEREKRMQEKPCTIPKYLREDYMNMAKVLDIALLDVQCMEWSYRELAAAVVFICYEPHSLVQEVTGYTYEQLLRPIEWLEPCYRASLDIRKAGDPFTCFPDVQSSEWHNIQTHLGENSVSTFYNDVRRKRDAHQRMRTEKCRVARRPGPLRTRYCDDPIS